MDDEIGSDECDGLSARDRAILDRHADFLRLMDIDPQERPCPECPEDGNTTCPLCVGTAVVCP